MAKSAPERYSRAVLADAKNPHDERHLGRVVAHRGRREDGFAVVAQRQDDGAGLAHPGLVEGRAFEHVADHIDPGPGHPVDHDTGLAGVVQHLDDLVPHRAVAGHHDRPGPADRHRHALDLLEIRGGADDDEDRSRLHLRLGALGRREDARRTTAR